MGQLINDIKSTAEAYVDNFKKLGNLDYSIGSLKIVDEQLDDLSCYDLNEEEIYNICSMIGCYVFETARKNYGGTYYWLEKEKEPILIAGEPDFKVSIRAWDKVNKFLKNGMEDNITFYIAGYKSHIKIGKNKKGYDVTLI